MFYLAKFDNEEFEKFKENKGEISIKFRMAGWIKKQTNGTLTNFLMKNVKNDVLKNGLPM